MGRVVHFEIHCGDLDRAERFYRDVFGWTLQRWKGAPIDYRLVTTGPDEEPGIDGALIPRRGDASGDAVIAFVNTVLVEDLADVERRVAEGGGTHASSRTSRTRKATSWALQSAVIVTSAPDVVTRGPANDGTQIIGRCAMCPRRYGPVSIGSAPQGGHHAGRAHLEGAPVIWMTFECPQTGQPLRTLQPTLWSADRTDALMALHCPKCSQMHMFSREHAILEMSGQTAREKLAV